MVSEPEDLDMAELQLPQPTQFSVLCVRMRDSPMSFSRLSVAASKPPRRPKAAPVGDRLIAMTEENTVLRSKLKHYERAAAAQQAADALVHEHYSDRERLAANKRTSEFKSISAKEIATREELKRVRMEKDELKEANLERHKLRNQVTKLTKDLEMMAGSLERQYSINMGLRDDANASVHRNDYQAKVDALVQLEAKERELQRELTDAKEQLEEATEKLAEATAGPGHGNRAHDTALKYLTAVKEAIGIPADRVSVPARTCPTTTSSFTTENWEKLSMRHMSAVLKGRGEGADIDLIAQSLERLGYLERLAATKSFMPYAKVIARAAVDNIQSHWSALHAVHVWDQLELSHRQMDTLSHLLSDVYHPGKDKYAPILAWQNPFNPKDYLITPRLANKHKRERCYQTIAEEMGIVVGDDGRCERDAGKLASALYTKYARALRSNFTAERPAQPVLFLDGTGGSLGKGICHGEIGCADFKKVGDSDTKQSRSTLQPLFLYQVCCCLMLPPQLTAMTITTEDGGALRCTSSVYLSTLWI